MEFCEAKLPSCPAQPDSPAHGSRLTAHDYTLYKSTHVKYLIPHFPFFDKNKFQDTLEAFPSQTKFAHQPGFGKCSLISSSGTDPRGAPFSGKKTRPSGQRENCRFVQKIFVQKIIVNHK
jgi:hypothetical protein